MCFGGGSFDKSNPSGLSRIPYNRIKFLYQVLDNSDLVAEEPRSQLRLEKGCFPALDTVIGGRYK